MNEKEAYIALSMIDKLGPIRVRALIENCGSPGSVMLASKDKLLQAKGIGPDLAEHIMIQRTEVDPYQELQKAKQSNIHLITELDEEYPAVLKNIHDPPLVLYIKGDLKPEDKHGMALVGSRRCSHYGRTIADRLAYQLSKIGYVVISGLARGIDTAAHKGALKGGGRTIAVLGSALDKVYPPENEALVEEIAKQGAVISEFPFGREPDRTTFPYRNRIVSGLSQGIVVVEAGEKSGALITADVAMDQGKAVFAVPGRVDTPASRGCHRLLKSGACLVENVDDILAEFEMLIPDERKQQAVNVSRRPEVALNPDEVSIVRVLGKGEMNVDMLTREVEISSGKISSLLIGLEMKRVIRMLPGRIVQLAVKQEDFCLV